MNLRLGIRRLSYPVLSVLLSVASGLAQAGAMPFSSTVDGVSHIVAVVDPSGPVVQVQTLAFGSGPLGALTYRSGD